MTNPGAAVGEAAPESPAPAEPRAGAAIATRIARADDGGTAPSGLAEADRLFVAGRWDESGRIYAAMAARNVLPAERRPHWAYCRYKAVVRRINERPRSGREWDEIEGEIRSIQRLTPGLWYGDYLTNKVAEIRKAKRRPATADSMVVRGSAPDEPSPQIQPHAPGSVAAAIRAARSPSPLRPIARAGSASPRPGGQPRRGVAALARLPTSS